MILPKIPIRWIWEFFSYISFVTLSYEQTCMEFPLTVYVTMYCGKKILLKKIKEKLININKSDIKVKWKTWEKHLKTREKEPFLTTGLQSRPDDIILIINKQSQPSSSNCGVVNMTRVSKNVFAFF